MNENRDSRKRLEWMGDSRRRLAEFPQEVREEIGYALYLAEWGETHPSAKPMKAINAVEIVSDAGTVGTFRGVYTTRFERTVYVLHCFQKKSKRGIETPKSDLDLTKKRLRDAERHHQDVKKNETKNRSRAQ
jgi:phage-related protein